MTNETASVNDSASALSPTSPEDKTQLLSNGIKLLEEAISHFLQIQGCPHSSALTIIAHGLLLLGQAVYETYQGK